MTVDLSVENIDRYLTAIDTVMRSLLREGTTRSQIPAFEGNSRIALVKGYWVGNLIRIDVKAQ